MRDRPGYARWLVSFGRLAPGAVTEIVVATARVSVSTSDLPSPSALFTTASQARQRSMSPLLDQPLQLSLLQQHDRFSVLDFSGFYHLQCLI